MPFRLYRLVLAEAAAARGWDLQHAGEGAEVTGICIDPSKVGDTKSSGSVLIPVSSRGSMTARRPACSSYKAHVWVQGCRHVHPEAAHCLDSQGHLLVFAGTAGPSCVLPRPQLSCKAAGSAPKQS